MGGVDARSAFGIEKRVGVCAVDGFEWDMQSFLADELVAGDNTAL